MICLLQSLSLFILMSSTVACNPTPASTTTTTTATTTTTTTTTTAATTTTETTKTTTTGTTSTTTTTKINPCQDSMEIGICSNTFQRFYYNQMYNECLPFNYTGCGGNLNNFITENECNVMCLNGTKVEDKNVIIVY